MKEWMEFQLAVGRINFQNCDLTGADLTGANLYKADLYKANLYKANLYGANLYKANLYKANLYKANLYGANLYKANLYKANLYKANLYGANLNKANLTGADLYKANLYKADLYGANLTGADLYKANLYKADLYKANLYGANLTKADITRADLYKANLSYTKGLINPKEWMNENFEKTKEGYIVYKSYNENYPPNPIWKLEKDKKIEQTEVDYDRRINCSFGINFGTKEWCNMNCKNKYYKHLLHFEDLATLVVSFATDGKARCGGLTLLEDIEK